MFPGSFSPYTDGHYSILKRFGDEFERKEMRDDFSVIIFKSSKSRENLSVKDTLSLVKDIYSNDNRVDVRESPSGNPIKDCYDTVNSDDDENNVYTLVSSSKDNDKRDEQFKKYFDDKGMGERIYFPDIKITPVVYTDRKDKFNDKPISSVIARDDIRRNDFDAFRTNYSIILKEQPSMTDKSLKIYFHRFKDEITTVPDKKNRNKKKEMLN